MNIIRRKNENKKKITDEKIIFNNGNEISCFHDQECCENNYANFEQIEELALSYDFEEDLIFEKLDKQGFRFGDKLKYYNLIEYGDDGLVLVVPFFIAYILTLIATVKDFIIKGVQGEFYFCKPDIFFQTYEFVCTSILQQGLKNEKV